MNAKSGIHVWSLQKRLGEFLNAENGIKFQSGTFPVADFMWQVIAYPNGNRFENMGSVMLYLKLLSYPKDLPYGGMVTANFRIQCRETHSSSTFIETYSRINDSKGWSAKNLLLSDLTKESITKITFQIDVKILKMINHNQRITYEAPLKIYKKQFNLKWMVQPDIVNRFQFANNGKWFESGNYSNLWCFKCAPNGYNEKNQGAALLFIQLCALPPNISKMKCKVKLFHVESDTKWTVKKEFGYDNKNAGWTKNKLSYDKLMKYDTITFRAEIEILSLFDLRGNKSTINNVSNTNYKYQAKRTYDDANIGKKTGLKKKNITNRGKRAATTSNFNPYGGYGSHNFHEYFNDGYKKEYNQQNENNKEKKEEESDDDDDDDEEDNYNSDASDEEEDELELNTIQEMQEQVTFLLKEYKKLNKIVSNLKQKSKTNDQLINALKNDIQTLKNKGNGGNGGNIANIANIINNTQSEPTKPTTNNGDDGLLDLFGGDLGGNQTNSVKTDQPQQNTDIATTNNADNAGINGWATF